MNTEKQRAAFEAWHEGYKMEMPGMGRPYQWPATQRAWDAWQAALESPEVQALMKALKVLVDNGGIGPESMFEDARDALAAMEKTK